MSLPAAWPWASACAQLQALREGEVSAVELLEATLARIERLHPRLNAVVVRDDARARDAARAADAARARGDAGPLLGLPMTVKESLAVAGLPTTMGDPAQAGTRAAADAAVVQRLRRAGAVILGKSNVPLGNGDIQTDNALYGLTRNPWDGARTPGGSSGGGAAAVAAGCVALEMGSDIGGSLRIPAHFCGVSALKPTWGLIDDRGNGLPAARLAARDIACLGPIARSAADLELALDVAAGPRAEDAPAWRLALPAPRATRLREFRVLLLDEHPLLRASAATQALDERLRDGLRQAGARWLRAGELAPGTLPDLSELHDVYQQLVIGSTLGTRPAAFEDEARAAIARLAADDGSYAATRVRAGLLTHRQWLLADEARQRIRRQWARVFEAVDIVLMPTSVSPAFAHDASQPRDARVVEVGTQGYRYLELFVWIAIASLAGLPALSFPVLRWQGLPLGAQAMAPWLGDRTALAFARAWETELGGFEAPAGWD
ncbi:MAG: amidase [Rubrivivax sp.]